MKNSRDNNGYVDDELGHHTNTSNGQTVDVQMNRLPIETSITETEIPSDDIKAAPKRDEWGNQLEFLMSCIACSVGLGNVWRFPFTALENGGGAFVIPYIIVLLLVGKPIYYLEMLIGQFSSRGNIKVYDLSPAMRGVGYGQSITTIIASTYYTSLMAITVKYFISSFNSVLPWSECKDEWMPYCFSSTSNKSIVVNDLQNITKASSAEYYFIFLKKGVGYGQVVAVCCLATYYASLMAPMAVYMIESFTFPLPWSVCNPSWRNCAGSENIDNSTNIRLASSSELFFEKEVLKEKSQIHDGLGLPDLRLTLCLGFAWVCVLLLMIRGVRSSGKASYFLALFPYLIMGILLVRAVTLPGAGDGIIYFLKPQWDQILNPKVWYAAVTQVFFSLSVCFGNIIMFSSYNKFTHNVHRDATIVTTLDTATSILAGCTIFGILGNLAHESGTTDIRSVVQGGTGLAFISYPEAIAKFSFLPQVFAVLFFLMLFVLGIGSNLAMTQCIMTVIIDAFPKWKHWKVAIGISLSGFLIGLVYVTPGGQFILNLVDYFGASFITFFLAIFELVTIGWIYGVNRFCNDVEFMLNQKPGLYWRTCWGIITPVLMISILIYFLATMEPLKYKDYIYPDSAYAAGYTLAAFGLLQVPIWGTIAYLKQDGSNFSEKLFGAFKPTSKWGPLDPVTHETYKKHLLNQKTNEMFKNNGILYRMKRHIYG